MNKLVAITKEADANKGFSPTKSDNSIHRVRNGPERQLGHLRSVIGAIRRDGGTPSAESIATQLSSMHTTQRAPALLALQQTHGNRYVQRVVSGIQAKLKIGQPGDMYEQEADRVADEVTRMPEPVVQGQLEEELQAKELRGQIPEVSSGTENRINAIRGSSQPLPESARAFFEPRFGYDFSKVKLHTNTRAAELARTEITPLMQRQESLGEEKDEELIQTKIARDVTPEVTPAISSGIQSLQGGGRPLSRSERSFFEPRFGADFSSVRVHDDTRAANVAQSVNARAFTFGNNVVLGAGEYSPDASSGRKLLAHELTHVVQQHSGTTLFSTNRNSENTLPNTQELSIVSREFYRLMAHELTRVPQQRTSGQWEDGGRLGEIVQRDPITDRNRERIEAIRQEAGNNDVEALARLFEDSSIQDDGSVEGRLRAILNATEHRWIPGLQTRVEFSDVGFRGTRAQGGPGFRDPHASSRNQPGHFLTAVGLSFDPAQLEESFSGRSIRDWLRAPNGMSNEEVAIRLTVGHEKASDPSVPNIGTALGLLCGIPGSVAGTLGDMLRTFQRQFSAATDADVQAFRQAGAALGSGATVNLAAAEQFLGQVAIDPQQRGNSIQDLRLSLVGWYLGQRIRAGAFSSGAEVAAWIRRNLM